MEGGKYKFHDMGIGKLLKDGRLTVPPNQRSYAWDDRHVTDLLQDLNDTIGKEGDEYFLGAVVLINSGDGIPTIADGQQRLATTTILLSRIRDRLRKAGRPRSAESVDAEFIQSIDRDTEEMIPRLTLNLEDNEFFVRHIIANDRVSENERDKQAVRASNRRLAKASKTIDEFLDSVLQNLPEAGRADHLLKWVKYLENSANIIVVRVSDELGAYRIFETLNDRGLRAGQADLLKNFFLSKAGKDRMAEAQNYWTGMGAALETLGDDDSDLLVTYIRHLWVTTNGPTKERELAEKIKKTVGGSVRALQFLTEASRSTLDYVALWSARHPKWNDYKPSTRRHIETIGHHLQVDQIRPLMFAVAKHFDIEEADKAFGLFVSWSVRFLVYGGRGGMLDQQYSLRAEDVGTGKITKARHLREAMEKYVPTDRDFEDAFKSARVSRSRLARYYLRALEKTAQGNDQPEYISNEEATEVNLEHILPLVTDEWDVDEETAKSVQKALGNMVLLKASENVDVAKSSFAEKKRAYSRSTYQLTRSVSDRDQWGPDEIWHRQGELARLAVKTWPLTFKR